MLVLKANIEGKHFLFALSDKEKQYILGAKEECDFCLPFKGVSRKHCEFFYKKNSWWVKDLNSTNGTYLNERRVIEKEIEENDVIICGTVSIYVLKKPTADWITTEGLPPKSLGNNTNLKGSKKSTDEITVPKEGSRINEFCKILLSDESVEEKLEKFMELMGIENLEIVYKYNDESILIFNKLKNANKTMDLIKNFLPEFEIKLYPNFPEDKINIISASCILLAVQKMGYKIPPLNKIQEKVKFSSPIGVSVLAKKIWERALIYKDSNVPILITGETGVGKEYFAVQLHKVSNRAKKPFIPINFSEYPISLMQTEIFGIEEKIATGVKKNIGKFELANGGTILLDEIGDLSLEWQLMLLRILENNYFFRVGGNEPVYLDVRFIFVTNKNILEEVEKGRIRKDFYYRIKGIHFDIPPLRERKEDISFFLQKFLDDLNKKNNKKINYSLSAWDTLLNYDWPGNVRELKNEIEKVYPLALNIGIIQKEFLTVEKKEEVKEEIINISLKNEVEKLEKELIIKAISCAKNMTEAMKLLDMPRTTFYEKLKKYKIKI